MSIAEMAEQPDPAPEIPAKRWLLRVSIFVIALAGIGLLSPVPFEGRAIDAFSDLLHAPAFFCITCLALMLGYQSGMRRTVSRISIVIVAILFGATMEVLQRFSGRNPAIHDIIANSFGAIAGWWCIESFLTASSVRRWLLRAGVIGLLIQAEARPAVVFWDAITQQREFPLIGSFESGHELQRWYVRDGNMSRSTEYVTHGTASARVELHPADYPAAMLFHLPPDWSRYDRLSFDVMLSTESELDDVELVLKVSDKSHDDSINGAFHLPIHLSKNIPRQISVRFQDIVSGLPNGTLDMRRVRIIELQSPHLSQPIVFYLDNVRLSIN